MDQRLQGPAVTDWRELCEELAGSIERSTRPYIRYPEVLIRARAALAQPEPEVAGPSDEELLGVAAQTIEPYDEIRLDEYEPENNCAIEVYGSELIAFARAVLGRWGRPSPVPAEGEVVDAKHVRRMCDIILGNTFGNEELDSLALLVGHHPDVLNASPPPAEGEVAELVEFLRIYGDHVLDDYGDVGEHDQLIRAANLLEQRQPAPVPVSERLPGAEDCDAEGRCWVGYPELTYSIADTGDTDTTTPEWRLEHQPLKPKGSRCCWLPAHALPLPSGEVQP